jgi:hypothetical protein
VEEYQGYKRVDIIVRDDDVLEIMRSLGFREVECHCVYEGPVPRLLERLRAIGWEQEPHHSNPYLLRHPQSIMTINYAQSPDAPSNRFVSYFRGIA